ncbi:MAG: type II toxin-antitoxin system RelE/ParE family toxin [Telluria sp.]
MMNKRVFKTKTFARWAKKVISDDLLCQAAREIERGEFEADLGHGKNRR